MIPARARSRHVPAALPPARAEPEKRELGQFFTSSQLADFIASFFTRPLREWRVIDAGAGSGVLTFALVHHVLRQTPRPVSFHVTAYEIDPAVIARLRDTLHACADLCAEAGVIFSSELLDRDFIGHTTASLEQGLFAPALKTFNASSRDDFNDTARNRLLPWEEIVSPDDPEAFIRLPATEHEHSAKSSLAHLDGRLAELGLKASTGKVVDFRSREHLRADATAGDQPLLYPCHFEAGLLAWPKPGGKKPNGIAVSSDRTDLLIPVGHYVVVRRFSSKEERKRIVASLIDPARLPTGTEWIGLENHLNYIHSFGRGLPQALAKGLTAYLNWSVVDDFLRHFNGHTQVNATDLRSLPYPSAAILTAIGEHLGDTFSAQPELD